MQPETPRASEPETPTRDGTPADLSRPRAETIRKFHLTVVSGPGAGRVRESKADRCSIGSHALNDLVIEDPTVSRFHCEIRLGAEGALAVDLKSRNGTLLDGVQVREAFLRTGSVLHVGRSMVRFDYDVERNEVPVSKEASFGPLVGTSRAMRATFLMLERAAPYDATVLLEGETGTGKGLAAQGIHQGSSRRNAPFVVVDCSAIPGNLLESELFGHERGAFTGAESRRVGCFEEASGGTVFLDEIGEMPQELQPKLLRVLENREFRRLGSNKFIPTDVRVIAATNRDLRAEVNAGRFRSDLYFRLAVVKILMPPLRDRPEDIPALVEAILASLRADVPATDRLLSPRFLADVARGGWPGNVRELRNYVERCLVIQDAPPLGARTTPPPASLDALPFPNARRAALSEFEKGYLGALMGRHAGNVPEAAGAAGVHRVYLYRLLRRHGIKATK